MNQHTHQSRSQRTSWLKRSILVFAVLASFAVSAGSALALESYGPYPSKTSRLDMIAGCAAIGGEYYDVGSTGVCFGSDGYVWACNFETGQCIDIFIRAGASMSEVNAQISGQLEVSDGASDSSGPRLHDQAVPVNDAVVSTDQPANGGRAGGRITRVKVAPAKQMQDDDELW